MNETELWHIAEQICTQKQLQVCRLLWLRQLSYRQTAIMLGIASSTVHGHERAARRRINQEMQRRKKAA